VAPSTSASWPACVHRRDPNGSGRSGAGLFHGGGFVIGSASLSLATCRDLAAGASASSSLPTTPRPEHPFPPPRRRARVTRWRGRTPPARGDPTGWPSRRLCRRNLAALCASTSRPRPPAPRVPHRRHVSFDSVRSQGEGTPHCLDHGMVSRQLLGDGDRKTRRPHRCSPPTSSWRHAVRHVLTAATTAARRGEAYAARLAQVGVTTVYRCYEGQMHASSPCRFLRSPRATGQQPTSCAVVRRVHA